MIQETGSIQVSVRAPERDAALLAGQRQVLTLLASGAPFRQTLLALCEVIEARLPHAFCTILLFSPERGTLHHGAAPRVPKAYCDAIDGAKIGPSVGSCGTAAYHRRSVTVEDIATDPLWADYRHLALPHRLMACASTPILDPEGQVLGTFAIYHAKPGPFEAGELGVLHDFTELATIVIQTERRRAALADAEASLRQAQKLESLGVLAGGIAHDFNNLLTIMLSNLSLAELNLPPVSAALPYVKDVETAVRRAADLTRQMLAYSGKGRIAVQPLDLSAVVVEMTHLLSIALPKKVLLECHAESNLPMIEADPAQMQQVVMNLVTNAAEAIGNLEGVVRITTTVTDLPSLVAASLLQPVAPGRYVKLEVSDNGCGMSAEVAARIFDPFFSTKQTGRGLGLSAMLGILRSHRAGLRLRSEPGAGSTFEIFFPVTDRLPKPLSSLPPRQPAPSPGGTVLVVDDEPGIRNVVATLMRSSGYEVLTASDGVEALEIVEEKGADISIVLMDLTMPRMGGAEALVLVRKLYPNLPVILCSGYSEEHAVAGIPPQDLVHFLRKPYKLEEVERAVEKALRGRE